MKNTKFKILATLLIPIFFLILIEISSFILLKIFFQNQKFEMKHFVSKKNASFKNIPDFDQVRAQLLDKTCRKKIFFNSKTQLPYFANSNHYCLGESVKNGLRNTFFQNNNNKNNIYVFGGSTIWGTGTSDMYTIPSLLQKKFNELNQRYTVHNYGFSTLVSLQQLRLLKQLKLKKGDIVIFYDGNNDIWQANINGNPYGTIIGYNSENKISIFFNSVKFFLGKYSNFYQFISLARSKKDLKCISLDIDKKKIEKNFNLYLDVILQAKNYTENKKVKFFHFFQPTVFTRKNNTDFEKYMISTMPSHIMPCNTKNGLFEIASDFYSTNYINDSKKINGKYLGDVFDNLSGDYFIDASHKNAFGNQIVVEEIFKSVINN